MTSFTVIKIMDIPYFDYFFSLGIYFSATMFVFFAFASLLNRS
jgi:hypothetical protein